MVDRRHRRGAERTSIGRCPRRSINSGWMAKPPSSFRPMPSISSTRLASEKSRARVVLPRRAAERRAMGNGDRHFAVHRLQRLRRRLPGREQFAGGRPRGDRARARHALAAHRRLRDRPAGKPAHRLPARALHALRDRAVRARLPDRRVGPRQRRAECPGLQSLHRHAVLRSQLSLQGAPIQLFRLCRRPGIRRSRRRSSCARTTIPTSRCEAAA